MSDNPNNTRTAANVLAGGGAEPFVRLLIQNYPKQRVGIVYDDLKSFSVIEKLLAKEGNAVTAYHARDEKIVFPENIRYFAGIGSIDVIDKVKVASKGNRHFFYCSLPDYAYVRRGVGDYAEYVYCDKEKINLTEPDILLYCYVRLFSLYAEIVNSAAGGLVYPFKLSGKGLIRDIKDFLLRGGSKESYLEDYLKLTREGVLYVEKNGGFTLDKLYKGTTVGEEYLSNYLLFVLCEIFTKWNFSDILMQNKERNNCYYDRLDELLPLLPSKRELSLTAGYARGLGVCLPDNAKESLKSLTKLCEGFFGELNGRGIIQGILHYGEEGNKGYNGFKGY